MNARRPVVRSAAFAGALLLAMGGPVTVEARPPERDASEAVQDTRKILVMLRLPPDHLRPGSGYGQAYGDRLASRARLRLARQIADRHGLELDGDGWPMPLLGIDCYVMRVPPGRTVDAVIAELSRDGLVTWSEPLQLYRTPGRNDRLAAARISLCPQSLRTCTLPSRGAAATRREEGWHLVSGGRAMRRST